MKKRGRVAPYVYVDVKKFMPVWALNVGDTPLLAEHEDDVGDISKICNVLTARTEVAKESKSKLDVTRCVVRSIFQVLPPPHALAICMRRWSVAYDAFALGQTAVEHQLSYAAAVAHKNTCFKVAFQACVVLPETFRLNLACTYDTVAR